MIQAAPLRLMLWYWGRTGAGPRYTLELARALRDVDGVEPSLCVSAQSELASELHALDLPALEIQTYGNGRECVGRTLGVPALRRRVAAFIRQTGVQVVDSTMTHLWSRFVAPAVTASGAKLLCTVHDATLHPGEDGRLRAWLYAPLPSATRYLALTHAVADRLAAVHRIARGDIDVLPLGALSYSSSGAPRALAGQGRLRVLFIGRILPYKGLDRLVEACAVLRAEQRPVDLVIAGTGAIDAATRARAVDLGARIENRWIEEAEFGGFLHDADVVALPYVEASQSGVVPAAYAAGVTAIATPVGGLPEQVHDGADGLVTRDTSVGAIAAALRALVDDRALLERLRRGALARAAADLAWPPIARRLTDIARAALASPSR